MIYAMFIAEVQPDKFDEYYKLQAEFRAFAEKHGVKFLGAWRTAVGKREEVITLEAHEDMADFERFRKIVATDPEYKEAARKLNKIRTVTIKLLQPTPYSPMI